MNKSVEEIFDFLENIFYNNDEYKFKELFYFINLYHPTEEHLLEYRTLCEDGDNSYSY
jgi:hypothetical protein